MKRVQAKQRSGTPSKKPRHQQSIKSFFSPASSRTRQSPFSGQSSLTPTKKREETPVKPPAPPPVRSEVTQPEDDTPLPTPTLTPTATPTATPTSLRKTRRRIVEDSDDSDAETLSPSQSSVPPSQQPTPAKATPAKKVAFKLDVFTSPRARQAPSTPSEPSPPTEPSPPSSATPPSSSGSASGSAGAAVFDLSARIHGAMPPGSIPTNKKARRKLMDLTMAGQPGKDTGWVEKHAWAVNVRDAQGRPPADKDYDPTTLYVPPELLRGRPTRTGEVLSPFQRQFWEIKSVIYDVIVFFKKGKFYEMYDVDADTVHTELGLNFTNGGRVDMRCCGVPESSFTKHAMRLIDLGYKVGRVEQTETAAAAQQRQKGPGGKSTSTVCGRSLVRIFTRATLNDEAMLRDHRARFVCAVAETELPAAEPGSKAARSPPGRIVGLAYADVAAGSINLHQYEDDFRLSRTERLISVLAPQQLVTDLSECSPRMRSIVTWTARKLSGNLEDLAGKGGMQPMTSARLADYLDSRNAPKESKEQYPRVCDYIEQNETSCRAFGALADHLKYVIMDKEALSLANYKLRPDPSSDGDNVVCSQDSISDFRMGIDAASMQNLEVLVTSNGSERDSLLSFIDKAYTPAGRRLLRKWISEPLTRAVDIEERLQAVEDLHNLEDSDGGKTLKSIVRLIKTKRDLERAVPKLHQFATVTEAAVMFDDTNKRKVKEFTQVLNGVHDCLKGIESLAEALESIEPKSKRLQWLCTPGEGVPEDAVDKLDYFQTALDVNAAESEGEIKPERGASPQFDKARQDLDEVEQALKDELKVWQRTLKDNSIKYYHRGKEPFQIEVSNGTLDRRGTPSEFEVTSESKSAQRFYTATVRKLVRKRVSVSEKFEKVSNEVARDIVRRFVDDYGSWSAVSSACAEIDALIGLAQASRTDGSGPMCRPTILPDNHPVPQVSATALRHPILAARTESFVANNVSLGGERPDDDSPHAMILTGPNAGGKSTLARQVALASIIAQIGCYVPAQSFTLRPFSSIMVRMGASDDMARGRSTFMVEMEEVSNMLNRATDRTLVIADEVGRGTSTHDGYAVAYAALKHLLHKNRALTIFSTHYSQLAEEITRLQSTAANGAADGGVNGSVTGVVPRAAVFEMAAAVDETRKQITFLYKLQRGSTTSSRGIYCARVASIPSEVADDAETAAMRFGAQLSLALDAIRLGPMLSALSRYPASYLRGLC